MSPTSRPPRGYSCMRCFDRKIKCDKLDPTCSSCASAGVECFFRVPPAPRPRRKQTPDVALLARLKRYEDLLRNNGIELDDDPVDSTSSSKIPTPSPNSAYQPSTDRSYDINRHPAFLAYQNSQAGHLLVDRGKSRFIENNLWLSASTEFQPKEAIVEQSSDEEDESHSSIAHHTDFMFGYSPSTNSIQQLHPPAEAILALWQIFLENINPLTKLLHWPSLDEVLKQALTKLDSLPRGLEALMFAIYTAAVTSMDDESCEIMLGESRKTLLSRYRHATRTTLARARFMATSDIQVLQAFTLYLLMMRKEDSRTTWALAGLASRIAQQMGLHRDGTSLGVSPFETEIRRRLWWQIGNLDLRTGELSGSGRYREFTLSDTRPPSNVDDAEIFPDMKEAPPPQAKATEMIACLLRCEFSSFWKEKVVEKANTTFEDMRILLPHATTMDERDARINELEQRLEERYLRYCDPTIPVQFMSILIGRATIDVMRLTAHCGMKFPKAEFSSPSEQKYLWHLCIKLIESDNLAHTTKALHRFKWHTDVYFHWQALIYLLYELRTQTLGHDVDKAWELLSDLFANHPEFVMNKHKPLHVAVGSLCVKAYDAREAALRQKTAGKYPKVIPSYVEHWREHHKQTKAGSNLSEPHSNTILAEGVQTTTASWTDDSNSQQRTLAQQQFPLPTSPPSYNAIPLQPTPSNQSIFASDPELAQDLAMAGMPVDWMQWDYVMQDFGAEV